MTYDYDIEDLIEDMETVLRNKHAQTVKYMIRDHTGEYLHFDYETLKQFSKELAEILAEIREDHPGARFRVALHKLEDQADTVTIKITSVQS